MRTVAFANSVPSTPIVYVPTHAQPLIKLNVARPLAPPILRHRYRDRYRDRYRYRCRYRSRTVNFDLFVLGKIIVKTRDPAPVQADLQADALPSGVLQAPPGPVLNAATPIAASLTLFASPHFARFPLLELRFPVGDVW